MTSPFQSSYATEQDAAFALLKHATSILQDCGVESVIVGGWVPYLFHRRMYGHPGTFDVDILINSKSLSDSTFESAAEHLLQCGYLRAVKNQFQAHRVLRVRNENFVFHVDFLNEKNQGQQLNIVGGRGLLQSIYTPAMEAVFKYTPFRTHGRLPGLNFPLVETFLASKAAATLVKKRPRDAFDAFITASDQDPTDLSERWRNLQADGLFRDANDAFLKALHVGDAVEKIKAQIKTLGTPVPTDDAILQTFSFLQK